MGTVRKGPAKVCNYYDSHLKHQYECMCLSIVASQYTSYTMAIHPKSRWIWPLQTDNAVASWSLLTEYISSFIQHPAFEMIKSVVVNEHIWIMGSYLLDQFSFVNIQWTAITFHFYCVHHFNRMFYNATINLIASIEF